MDIKDFVGDLFGFTEEIQALKINYIEEKKDRARKEFSLNNTIDLLKEEILELKKPVVEELDWLTEKIPKQQVLYQRTEKDKKYMVDVHNYLCEYDSTIPIVKGKSNDEKALNSLNWVHKNIVYESDYKQYKENEFWAYPYQTLYHKKGDCEDGAILLWNILIKSGVPWQRVRFNCGDVKGGGHAYITYCRESDDEFVVLDWCYWYNNKLIKDRPTHKEERNYFDEERNFYVWFSADKKFGYAKQTKQTIEINGAKIKIK